MKRIAAILFGFAVIFLAGCTDDTPLPEENTAPAEIAVNETEQIIDRTNSEETILDNSNYRKYKIEQGTVDADAFLNALFAEQPKLIQSVQMKTVEADGGNSTEYSVTVRYFLSEF